jgi:carbonic anhydrase
MCRKKREFFMKCFLFFIFLQVSLFSLSPQESLEKLKEGNNRYIEDQLLHGDQSAARREAVSPSQEPFAVILGCSDSRVPPELIFDQGLGDLFVIRVAGNVVGPLELDSVEYSVKHLHSSLVVVLGHQNCGAVSAVLEGQTDEIEDIALLIEPAIRSCAKEKDKGGMPVVNLCVRENVRSVVSLLKNSHMLSRYLKEKKIEIIGAYYDLDTGKVEILD